MKESASIILVDDHVVVRNALKELLEAMGPFNITHQFNNGSDFVAQIPFAEPPDLIIMDLIMPLMNGKEVLEWLREHKVNYPVLILSMETDQAMILSLFNLGMKGYLPKACTAEMLKTGIDDILNKGHHYNDLLIEALHTPSKTVDKTEEILKNINGRELEFLRLVCRDEEYTYKQIAGIMNVHRRTIDGYRERLFEKCSVVSKSGLVQFAIRNKLV
jgi:two-component system invasion response regulator UvrY